MAKNDTDSPTTPNLAILTFRLVEQTYSLAVTEVVKIIEMVTLTHLPQMPHGVQGVINFQGQITPVLDLRIRFGLKAVPYHLHTPIILVDFKGQPIGLIVDQVETILEIPQADLEKEDVFFPTASENKATPTSYLDGIAKAKRDLIPLLKVSTLLTADEQSHLEHVITTSELEGLTV